MGFWKNIKGIWDPQARAESAIDTQISCFKIVMHRYPERDPNAWLALTLRERPTWRARGLPEFTYYTETALFSLLPRTQMPLALGLFILFKEEPALAAVYSDRFEQIMAPIFALAKTGQTEEHWRSVNPWTAKHFPEVASGLRAAAGL
ncbi:MAG: hypothetical protein ACE5I9_03095 [Candidatus Methylomirabilales bacterium]